MSAKRFVNGTNESEHTEENYFANMSTYCQTYKNWSFLDKIKCFNIKNWWNWKNFSNKSQIKVDIENGPKLWDLFSNASLCLFTKHTNFVWVHWYLDESFTNFGHPRPERTNKDHNNHKTQDAAQTIENSIRNLT